MISIKKASKSIEDKRIFNNININIEKGSIFGLIGTNGAGKTSIIKCLTGIWSLDKGNITIDGADVYDNLSVKRRIGYVTEQSSFYNDFTTNQIKKFFRLGYENFDEERYNQLNKVCSIPSRAKIKSLSKGMKMKFSIMINLCIQPDILVLDEPISGLDPLIKRQVLDLIIDYVAENGTTVFISSHNLSAIELFCDSIAVIDRGNIVYQNRIEEMKSKIRKLQVVFRKGVPEDFSELKNIISIDQTGSIVQLVTSKYDSELKSTLSMMGAEYIEDIDLSLEDMFIYSIGGSLDYEEIL